MKYNQHRDQFLRSLYEKLYLVRNIFYVCQRLRLLLLSANTFPLHFKPCLLSSQWNLCKQRTICVNNVNIFCQNLIKRTREQMVFIIKENIYTRYQILNHKQKLFLYSVSENCNYYWNKLKSKATRSPGGSECSTISSISLFFFRVKGIITLTHFSPMFHFYTLCKPQGSFDKKFSPIFH